MKPNTWTKALKSNPHGNCVEAMFLTAFASNGNGGNNCVEVALSTAEASGAAGHCVEVSTAPVHSDGCVCESIRVNGVLVPGAKSGDILVRDSKDKGNGPVFVFTAARWRDFIVVVQDVRYEWLRNADGDFLLENPALQGQFLRFTPAEWDAFLDGVRKGEFTTPQVDTSVS